MDWYAVGLLIGGILFGLGGGGTVVGVHVKGKRERALHATKVSDLQNQMSDLDRDTRERVLKVEEKVENLEKTIDKNFDDVKSDLKYIVRRIDKKFDGD